jgi:hypothetical protein
MRRNQQRLLWLGISILGVLILSSALLGQASPDSNATGPVPTDWSHHHLIFSRPATAEQAKRVQQDPRYWQQLRRQSPARLPGFGAGAAPASGLSGSNAARGGNRRQIHRDWSEDMGTGATAGAGTYPAKYSFNLSEFSCTNDFVVYATGLFGAAQASIIAYNNLYSGCVDINLGTAANFAVLGSSTVTNAGDSVVTGANIGISPGTSLTGFPPGVLTPPASEDLGDPVASQAQADASTAYTYYQGLTGAAPLTSPLDGQTLTPGLYNAASSLALSAGATVTLNGNGAYIFQIGSTLNLAGTVALSGGALAGNVIWLVGSSATLQGTAVAAGSIVALASITLDSGASLAGRAIALNGAVTMIDNAITTVDTLPSVYWAYNTAAAVTTSPVFSRDGTQVAFVQKDGLGNGVLLLVKWAASTTETIASPLTLTGVFRAQYATCPVPCKYGFPLDDAGTFAPDTHSSVFYDYSDDVAYVGDDLGFLHKFTPFFLGTPAEVTTGNWPVQVNPGTPTALTSPVHDYASGNVFVADAGGFLYRVDSSTGAVTQSGQLDFSEDVDSGPGIVESPIVDSTSGLVYVFAPSDASGGCASFADCAGVYQLTTNFLAGATGSEAVVGASTVEPATPNPLYIGAFDSTYENSAAPPTGNLYVCGNTGGTPTIYQIPIKAGTMGEVNTGPVLSTGTAPCSPVTDILNPNATGGATEWLFASAQTSGVPSVCSAAGTGGCVMNLNDSAWLPSTAYSVGQEVLDTGLHIEVVKTAGVSGGTEPTWNGGTGGATADNTVTWLDQGSATVLIPANWVALHHYPRGSGILDPNGNIELVTSVGTDISGSTIPTFSSTVGRTTTGDGTITWTNLGAVATASLPAAGGTGGLIIDNIVGSGNLAGASQVYFSTLKNQSCGTSGTGGCAVQASQSGLQ